MRRINSCRVKKPRRSSRPKIGQKIGVWCIHVYTGIVICIGTRQFTGNNHVESLLKKQYQLADE